MLMYDTTMFLIHTVADPLVSPSLRGTVGALPGTRNLAGGMATSGAITGWLRTLLGSPDYAELLALAVRSGVGANGLLMLPLLRRHAHADHGPAGPRPHRRAQPLAHQG